MSDRIGFMQGRLSSVVDGRIQAFPWSSWQKEFVLAEQNDFHLMEWTLDQALLYENPLMTSSGRAEIQDLCRHHGIKILSLTGDCFMQKPFWKAAGKERETLQKDFCAIAESSADMGIQMIIVPLVDNGRLDNRDQEDVLVSYLKLQVGFFREKNLKVVFESDFEPDDLARFIERLDSDYFGINYDIGNSAALGFSPEAEFLAYGKRVCHVHIKDRVLRGTTVPLGTGVADFKAVFRELSRYKYNGNYILQTARASDGNHVGALCRYRNMAQEWLGQYAS